MLVWVGYGGNKSTPKRRFVVKGFILKKGKHSDNYKIQLILPSQSDTSEIYP